MESFGADTEFKIFFFNYLLLELLISLYSFPQSFILSPTSWEDEGNEEGKGWSTRLWALWERYKVVNEN